MNELPEIHAGFPSPSTDYMNGVVDLNRELVRHPDATFYGRVVGDSMADADVHEGDVLVIDKAIRPTDGSMVVCFVDGEFCLKYLSLRKDGIWLLPGNSRYKPIRIDEGNDFSVWGVVTYIIKKVL